MISQLHFRLLCGILAVIGGCVNVAAHDEHPHEHDGDHSSGEHQRDEDRFMTTRDNALSVPMTKQEDAFQFLIYGDRTGGVPEGLKVLEQAVADSNLLDPDLVMTVGDLIQGYNEKPEWIEQMKRYRKIMGGLNMQWYPVAGNHDVYWRGKTPPPPGQHEANYEEHFGPLWYAFSHKQSGFIVLYSDEGDRERNQKGFNEGRLQKMSDAQLTFLRSSLERFSELDHVFVFLHHPRWIMPRYQGGNWDVVHQSLKDAGNVSAVFAGHIHHIHYEGDRDGIEYHTLATTGGSLQAEIPDAGYLHHMNVVTVREDRFTVASLPVGAVFDPKQFTPEFLDQVQLARSIRMETESSPIQLQFDGSANGDLLYSITNPCKTAIEGTLQIDGDREWISSIDHQHFRLEANETKDIPIKLIRRTGAIESLDIPRLALKLELLSDTARVRLPESSFEVPISLSVVPIDYFADQPNRYLRVDGERSVAKVESDDVRLPIGPMTLEAWLRPRDTNGFQAAIAKTENSEFSIFVDEGVPQFDLNLGGKYYSAKAKTKLPVDQWTHVAGVFDENAVKLYVDGKQIASVPGKGKRRTNRLPLYVGADPSRNGKASRPFKGDVDEVRLSSSVIYQDDFAPTRRLSPQADTVLMLHFDRNFGPFVLDHSTRAVKATLAPSAMLTGE